MYMMTSTPWLQYVVGDSGFGPCSWRRGRCMQPQCTQWPLLQVYFVGTSFSPCSWRRGHFIAAKVYTMTPTPGVCRGGQPLLHVPYGEGTACSHNVHNDLFSRCMLWGQPSIHVPERRGHCLQPQSTLWPLLQVYAVGDSLRCMFLREIALHAATMYTMTSTLQ